MTINGNMKDVNEVQAIAGKGILNDRYYQDNNDKETQITFIESENIDYYNTNNQSNIKYIEFRRNIITENISLNELVGKEFFVGKVRLKAHDLCRPCKYLQNRLKQNNFVKEFLHKGGLRCEILTDGIIKVGDILK